MMGSKVLLADDSVTIQKVVGIIFANEGYELTTVASGNAAIEKAIEIKPDVMLVDALMPGKNGYEVCREVRQDPALRHIAILLMTGAFEVVDEEKNRQSGADEFIIKPFESQALIDATNRMIALTSQRSIAPVAPQAAPLQAPAEVIAAASAPSVDDVWATGFDMEPGVDIQPEAVFTTPPVMPTFESVAPVKATADDDLWGAFDMDSVELYPPAIQVTTPVAAAPDDNFFSFETEPSKPVELSEEDEFVLEELAIEKPLQTVVPTATGFEPVGEQELSFADLESASIQEFAKGSIPDEDDFSTITFDEPAAYAAPVPPPLPPIVEMPPPVAPAAPPIPEPQAPVSTATAVPASLDAELLKTLLSKVSRDVIERIVWEVVPDLAETIIKEEIRKLKAGIA